MGLEQQPQKLFTKQTKKYIYIPKRELAEWEGKGACA
jgi:hypothetical protein